MDVAESGRNEGEYEFRTMMGSGQKLNPNDLEFLKYEKDPDQMIATVTLNRPEKLNALNIPMRDEIDAVVRDLEEDDVTKVVIIKGAGKSFCGGYDLAEIRAMNWSGHRIDPNVTRRSIRMSQERWMRLWNVRQITIAQVHGYCLVGGVDLIAVCDLVFATEDAQFGQPQARRQGLIHTFGMYPMYIGPRKTKEYALTGEAMSGADAERLGLINHALPTPEALDSAVMEYAMKLTDIPGYMLYAQKDATNRWYETYGVRAAMHAVDDLDAIVLAGEGNFEFGQKVLDTDLKSALKERDAPFGDFNARPRD
ncbi:MAG: enoyl-CoA hydratase [Thermoleophilaceae bacterium]|jgi:enoyl-CoA hydratase|nr:enoyl-CoA hydratase [Thermoleophilaceae bacterium]